MVNAYRNQFVAGRKARIAAPNRFAWIAALAVAIASGACTVHDTKTPDLSGPSEAALSLVVTATPDSISHDGASQSSIQVWARDATGKAVSGLPLRMDMNVNGQLQDYGALSARTIVTGNDGKANTIFTAPPPPPSGSATPGCAGTIFSPAAPGTCVNVLATPTSNAYQTVTGSFVTLRLVPMGVILPPGATPTASFSISPTPVKMGTAATFDASASCAGTMSGGSCSAAGSVISSYSWNFGDGTSGSGKVASHTFSTPATFNVTLTVTNDRGLAASTTQAITVGASAPPSGDWVFSPSAPVVGQTVFFNADGISAAQGRTLVQFNWDFGDGSAASGFTASHTFSAIGTYKVVLSVLDDLGQKMTFAKDVAIK